MASGSGGNGSHKKTTIGMTKAKKRRKRKKRKKDSMGREWGDPDYGIPF